MIYKFLLNFRKRLALYETRKDIQFIEKFRRNDLDYDIGASRRRMGELMRKEDKRTPDEENEYAIIRVEISRAEAVKKELQDLRELEVQLQQYISL